ncbi:protein MFI [Ciona intestinalis]
MERDKTEILNQKEAVSILTAFSQNTADSAAVSLKLARATKSERRKHIKHEEATAEKLISAVLEISRHWRGFACRKSLRGLFVGHDDKIQEKQKPPQAIEIQNSSSILLSVEQSEQSVDSVHAPDTPEVQDIPVSLLFLHLYKSCIFFHNEHTLYDFYAEPTPEKVKPPKCRVISNKSDAASVIQRSWRRHIDMQVFRYYRDLINFRGHGDPALMLKCINPNESKLLDSAAGVHVRFRLAGEKFPPNIYYKIFTHRPVVDMCANSPKDYTKVEAKVPVGKQVHNKTLSLNTTNTKEGWYVRHENNGWRLVSDRLIYSSMDPVTWQTSKKTVDFHHTRVQRQADVDHRRRKRKIEWMRKMYKDGMLHARETDQETSDLVDRAAKGLVNTVDARGTEAVMEWEVDELLQWTTALNFDDYLEVWKEAATSNVSEKTTANLRHNTVSMSEQARGVMTFDPYSMTRGSSDLPTPHKGINKGDSPQLTRSKFMIPMIDAS